MSSTDLGSLADATLRDVAKRSADGVVVHLEVLLLHKLTVPPRDIRDPAVAWRFLNEKYNTHTIADSMALRNQWASFRMTD